MNDRVRATKVVGPLERPRHSRFAAIALALTLSALTLVGLWRGFRPAPVDGKAGEATRESVDLDPRVTAVVRVGPQPTDVAIGEGAVWVSVPAQQPEQDNLIVRIDPATSEVAARIPVANYVEELAAGEGGVWANAIEWTDGDPTFSLVRIDAATNEIVAEIPDVSAPLAVGGEAVWAVDRAGARAGPEGSSLLRIDPATNQVAARIPLGVSPWDIEFGEGYVWVLSLEPEPGEDDILQVDPVTNEVVARIAIPVPGTGYPPTVYAPAVGEGIAWVPVCCPDNELQLFRVDVDTSRVVGDPVTLPGGAPFAAAAGHVWIIEERGALYGLNVATLEMDEAISGFDWPAGGFPDPSAELDLGQLAVWVVNSDQDSVTRIELAPGTPGPTPFEPDATIDGGVARINVTFPDGSAATVSYPSELDLASLGVQPDVSYVWRDDPPARHPIVFLHGPPGIEGAYVQGDEPTATFPLPAGGEAAFWPAGEAQSHRLKDIRWWLVYRTESWSALASLRSEGDAEALASALAINEAETGLPFVITTEPVHLAEYAGEDEGPVLAFGDSQPDPSMVSDLDALIFLSPETCSGGPEFDDPPSYASTCLADGKVFAGIYGDPQFIHAVLDGLRVASFSHPSS